MRRKWRVMDCCVTNLWSLQENCNQDYYFSQTHILTSWHKLQAHHRRLNMLPQWKGNQISLLLSPRILLSCRLSYIAFFWTYKNDKFCVERKMLICKLIVKSSWIRGTAFHSYDIWTPFLPVGKMISIVCANKRIYYINILMMVPSSA